MSDGFFDWLWMGEDVPDEVGLPTDSGDLLKQQRWLSVFVELCKSRRFRDFLEANFVIQDVVDHDAKTFTTLVVENPLSVGARLAPEQVVAIRSVLGELVKDKAVPRALAAIMAVLGQEVTNVHADADVGQALVDTKVGKA